MTSITHGMDPDEVDALAVELRRISDELDRLARTIDGRVRSTRWSGPTSARFKNQWWPKHRASLVGAANELRGFADSARNNASEQRGASGNAGSGGGSGGGSSVDGSWIDEARRMGSSISQLDEHVAGPLGTLFGSIGDLRNVTTGAPMVPHAAAFSKVGTGLGLFSMGVSTMEGADSPSQRHYLDAFFSGGDTAASGLKMSKAPYAYLIGTTAQAWLEAGRAAKGVDWSPDGLRLIADASPREWVTAFGEAITLEFPKRLPKIFAP